MDRLGVATRSDAKELYELLTGRARAVDAALKAAEQLERAGNLPYGVYEDFTAEYERKKDDLNDATARLLRENPNCATRSYSSANAGCSSRKRARSWTRCAAGSSATTWTTGSPRKSTSNSIS
jgi:hypothetical protein